MIYVDNAATSYPKPMNVIKGVEYAVTNYTSPNRGHYKSSYECTKMIYETREVVAKFFGIDEPLNVAFTQNATESINLVIKALFDDKDHIITSELEHNSVLRTLENSSISYSTLGIDENYEIQYKQLDSLMRRNTRAIIITHSSNILGNIVDLDILSKFCKENNLYLILDVAQSAGVVPINLIKQNVDIVCFTGHKSLFGVTGIGGIVVNDSFDGVFKVVKSGGTGYNSLSLIHDNKMPEVFEAGTSNFVGIKSLYEGVKFVSEVGLETIIKHEKNLVKYTYDRLKYINGIKIYGDFNNERTPVISLTYKDYDTNDIADILFEEYGIATRAGFHCVALLHEKIGTLSTGLLRISYSYMNTLDDAKAVCDALCSVLV